MDRVAFVLNVKPEKLDEYVAAHADVWPEMLEAMRDAGVRNYTIFLRGTEAFGYCEADDIDAAWSRLLDTDVNRRWQAAMAEYLEQPVDGDGAGPLREIFRMD